MARNRKKSSRLNNRFLLIAVLFLISFIIILKYSNTTPLKKTATVVNHVPEPNDKFLENGLAVPKSVRENSPGSKMKIRSFDITAYRNILSVKKIIVKEKDVVRIEFSALDKDYLLTIPAYGVSQRARKGETKMLEFQAIADGSFDFSCQSPDTKTEHTKGTLIVMPET